jgi:hypothetical protein
VIQSPGGTDKASGTCGPQASQAPAEETEEVKQAPPTADKGLPVMSSDAVANQSTKIADGAHDAGQRPHDALGGKVRPLEEKAACAPTLQEVEGRIKAIAPYERRISIISRSATLWCSVSQLRRVKKLAASDPVLKDFSFSHRSPRRKRRMQA